MQLAARGKGYINLLFIQKRDKRKGTIGHKESGFGDEFRKI